MGEGVNACVRERETMEGGGGGSGGVAQARICSRSLSPFRVLSCHLSTLSHSLPSPYLELEPGAFDLVVV